MKDILKEKKAQLAELNKQYNKLDKEIEKLEEAVCKASSEKLKKHIGRVVICDTFEDDPNVYASIAVDVVGCHLKVVRLAIYPDGQFTETTTHMEASSLQEFSTRTLKAGEYVEDKSGKIRELYHSVRGTFTSIRSEATSLLEGKKIKK